MSTTTANPTHRPTSPTSPPRARRTRFALAAAAGLIATTAAVSAENLVTGDSASGQGFTTGQHWSQPCRLSEKDVANWGETSAHLPQACSDGN